MTKNPSKIFFLLIIVHLLLWTLIPSLTNQNLPLDTIEALAWGSNLETEKWERIKDVRKVVTGAIELERKAKKIGSSLEVSPIVYLDKENYLACSDVDMEDICITSGITIINGDPPSDSFYLEEINGVGVLIKLAEGEKCERCWKILKEVVRPKSICYRCAEVVS